MINRREALTAGTAFVTTALLPRFVRGAEQAPTNISCGGSLRLACGRFLKYHRFGNPTGPLVFYFHGTPGSRIEAGLIEHEANLAGVHLVSVDRPGMGRSTYYANRRVTDWPCDVETIADSLGYAGTSFGVIGMSGGTPYATVCARMIPHRLTHVAIVSGHAPLGTPGVSTGSADKAIALITRRPRLGRMGVNFIARRLDRRPDRVVAKITKDWTAADRNLILCNPLYHRMLIANLRESAACGGEGLVTDISLLACDWGFKLCDIHGVGVSIWQGGCDRIAPPSTGKYFHRQIAGSEFHLDPKAGHVTMLKWHASEIFARFQIP
jgi:pimeloyl-ACP methyl ester carboxylesterase